MASRKSNQRNGPGTRTPAPRGSGRTWFANPLAGRHPRLGLAALVLAVIALGGGSWYVIHASQGKKIRNILLISIDTCRADRLSCYGYAGQVTRNVDALARDGVRFTSVITPFPMTLPAHCSMLTGCYPETHGVQGNFARLGENNTTLAKVLRNAGYQTAAVVGGFPMSAQFGVGQGFQTYDDHFPAGRKPGEERERKAEDVSRRGMAWLTQNGSQPFFLFLHYYDPHYPYDPPSPYPPTYDGELAYTDVWVGKVIDKLRELGLYDNTLVVLAGDHGEGLSERGEKEHGFLIYQNTVHVPLIVRAPGGPRDSRVDDNASLVDIVPTVLGLTGLAVPPQVEGADLSGYLSGAPPKRPRLLYTESLWPELYGCCGLFGVIDGSWKYIRAPKPELYDLSRDGEEKHNLVERQPQIARRLRDRLEQWEKAIVAGAKPQGGSGTSLPKGTLQQLETFGYVGGGTGSADFGADLKLEDAKDFVVNFERCKEATELMAKRRYDEARKMLLEVVAERPKVVLVHFWLGQIAVSQSRPDDAVRELSTAVSLLAEAKIAPTSSAAEARRTQAMHCHMALGRALMLGEKYDPAIVEFQTAYSMEPEAFEDNTSLVNLLAVRGRFAEAVAHCRKVLQTGPGNLPVQNKLAWMLATCPEASVRSGAEAVAIARRLTQGRGGNEPNCLATLAAAYAEADQFPAAVAAAERAVALAQSSGQTILVLKFQSQLARYRAGRPCREIPTGGVVSGPQAAGRGE